MSRLWFTQLLAVAFLAGGTTLTACAAEPEKSDKPAVAGKADDKQDAKKADATDKADPTPDDLAKQIEADLVKGIRSDRKAAVDAFQKAKDDFVAKHPTHAAQWKLKMLGVQVSMMSATSRDEAAKQAQAGLADILASKDADPQIREQASMMRIQLADTEKPDEYIKIVVDHLKTFPEGKMNKRIAKMAVMSLGEGDDEEKSVAKLTPLTTHEIADIAAAARAQIEQLKTLIELKTKPIEMKFTSVDGREIDMNSYRGKVVLIDFWATWCGPCIAELPNVKETYKELHEKGFEIIGISFDQEKEALEKFVAKQEMPWPQYFDGAGWDNAFGKKYGITGIPAMWLVGKDGKVANFKARGKLTEKVEKLLAQ